jgi:hypothetical protein
MAKTVLFHVIIDVQMTMYLKKNSPLRLKKRDMCLGQNLRRIVENAMIRIPVGDIIVTMCEVHL